MPSKKSANYFKKRQVKRRVYRDSLGKLYFKVKVGPRMVKRYLQNAADADKVLTRTYPLNRAKPRVRKPFK